MFLSYDFERAHIKCASLKDGWTTVLNDFALVVPYRNAVLISGEPG